VSFVGDLHRIVDVKHCWMLVEHMNRQYYMYALDTFYKLDTLKRHQKQYL